ncbi:MAG: sigma-70 family RNA polymerase sigma factor [Planctomycetota bacterium]
MDQLLDNQGQWLEPFRPYLTLLARTQMHSRPHAKFDASDIVQQTLLDAFAQREQFRGSGDAELAGWLRQILKHNLVDALRDERREKRDVRREQSLEGAIEESFGRTQDWLAAVQSSPSQRAVKQEDLIRLAKVLTELPDSQRDAIVLHHLQGLKLAEVATEMGRTEASVAGLLFRGLRTLHSLLCE